MSAASAVGACAGCCQCGVSFRVCEGCECLKCDFAAALQWRTRTLHAACSLQANFVICNQAERYYTGCIYLRRILMNSDTCRRVSAHNPSPDHIIRTGALRHCLLAWICMRQ